MKTTFLYLFCIVLFPVFNISFKATKLFLYPRNSLDKFGLGVDQVKSLFEDSPQLALQLFICFIAGAHRNQILAIIWSSLTVAVPNLRSLIDHEKSRMQSFKSKVIFYFIFVLISFTRAASIAFICCFLRYNAIIVYICTFLALKIVFDIAKLISKNGLAKMSQETQGDVIANAFNILDLKKDSLVIRCYAVIWTIFNVAVLLKIDQLISYKDPILLNLWIAPSFKLKVWSENFIVQKDVHQALLIGLCGLNMLSCILICFVIKPIGIKPEYETVKSEDDQVLKTSLRKGNRITSDQAKEIWSPYSSSNHFESIFQSKRELGGLSTMTQLKDPWDFVSDYATPLLQDRRLPKINHFQYQDAQQLLLKIMNVLKPEASAAKDPEISEVFYRCRRHYDFLDELKQEYKSESVAEEENPEDQPLNPDAETQVQYEPTPERVPETEGEAGTKSTLVSYNPVSALIEAVKATCLHMQVISLGLRNIKRDFRIIEELKEDEEKLETEEDGFGKLFKVLHKQIGVYGQAAVPESEKVVKHVKTVFVDFIEYVFKHQTEDDFSMMEIVTELKSKLENAKANATAISEKHQSNLIELASAEVIVVDSLSKFNEVTDRYRAEMKILEEESRKEPAVKKNVLAAWDIMSLGLSVQVMRQESETSKDKNELMRRAQNIKERNGVRENIAITAKAIIIPSLKKYISNFRNIATFFSDMLAELETLNEDEIGRRDFFYRLQLRSAEVKETCSQFLSAMIEVRTDLAV